MKKKITLQGILIIVAAALLGITGTTVGVMALMGQSSAVTVDNFVGKTKKVVETWRKDNSIETDRVIYVYAYDEEKEKDVVLRQNLKAGTSFTSDSNLKITLSNGVDPDKEFELPDFKDKTEKEVKAWFTDNKFTAVTYAYETDDSITPGNFISMDKEAGSKVKRSDAIKVTICTPLEGEEVLVPSLATMSKDEITSWADQNRINVSFVERASDTVAQGGIISVSVTEGQRLKPGDSVTVEISTGPADQGEDRYNAQQKDNTEVNGTPPANENVSGGNPTGNTTPSDNTNTGETTTTPAENESSGGNEETEQPVAPQTYMMPYIEVDLYDGKDSTEIMNSVSAIVAGAGIPGNVNYIVQEGSFVGIYSITQPNTEITSANEITCVIYYTR